MDAEHSVESFGRQLARLARSHQARAVLVHLAAVTFVSSRGLGKLVALYKELAPDGIRVALYAMRPNVREVFAITRIDRVLAVHAAEDFPADLAVPETDAPQVMDAPEGPIVVYAPRGMVF